MILRRLYELAERKKLLTDPAFDPALVACVIHIGKDGRFLRLDDYRTQREIPPKGKKGKPKLVRDKGKPIPIPPRPVLIDPGSPLGWKLSNAAVNGPEKPAVFLADTLPRVLPLRRLIPAKDTAKFDSQRSTFYRFIAHVAAQTGDPALEAIKRFSQWVEASEKHTEELCTAIESVDLSLADVCTFAYEPDGGASILEEHEAIRQWWRDFYEQALAESQQDAARGLCQITERLGLLADGTTTYINGLKAIGCRADAYLVAPLKSAESYGLRRAANGMVSEEGLDAVVRALNALIADRLFTPHRCRFLVGNTMFLYWTREETNSVELETIEFPTTDRLTRLFQAPLRGIPAGSIHEADFYCLALSASGPRIVVKDYLEAPIQQTNASLRSWFSDLRIVDPFREEVTCRFPLSRLLKTTTAQLGKERNGQEKTRGPVPSQLMRAALENAAPPITVLGACLRRLQVEGTKSFRPVRMGLIRLCVNRSDSQGDVMQECLNPGERNSAYVCGRLLAVYERIQRVALGKVNSSVVDRFYGAASATPSRVFHYLADNAQAHLRKLRNEKVGVYSQLDRLLCDVSSSIPASGFPDRLGPEDQGRFALGYYHQKAKLIAEALERKRIQARKKVDSSPSGS